MKILAIRLKNLASLAGPIVVDFTAEPLASAGLFAITGPTGAGKSTLLDALCLALFGAVPRLSRTGRDAKVPDIEGEIATGDPRTLLRRGTGDGYAEVDFIGIDGRRYRARWEANRAREKAGGKLQASRQSLRDLDNGQLLASQKNDYKTQLEARLGLNFEQFTRAVLLAQSEFSAFLKADDNERSELLEKLTDTALYTQLGKRAFEKSKAANQTLKDWQTQANGVLPLNDEDRAALDSRSNDAQLQFKAQQDEQRQLLAQQQWQHQLQALEDVHASAAEQCRHVQEDWAQRAEERHSLMLLEQLAPQRYRFARQHQVRAELAPMAQAITEHLERQVELQDHAAQLQARQTQAQSHLEAAERQLQEQAQPLRAAFDAESEQTRLRQTTHASAERLQRLDAQFELGQTALQRLQEQQDLAEQTLQKTQQALEESAPLAALSDAWGAYAERLQTLVNVDRRQHRDQQALAPLQAHAEQAELALLPIRTDLATVYSEAQTEPSAIGEQVQTLGQLLQDNRQQQRAYAELQRLSQSQWELERSDLQLQEQQQVAQTRRDQLTQSGIDAKARLVVAEQALSITQQLLERQRVARSASVEELRGQLEQEQPCPVCGSVEHPYHRPEALLQSLDREADAEEHRARLAVQELSEQLAQMRGEIKGLIERQKELLQKRRDLAEQLTALTPTVQAHPFAAALHAQSPERQPAWLEHQLTRLNTTIAQDEARQHALLKVQQDAGRLQNQLQIAQDTAQAAAQACTDLQRQITLDQARYAEELSAFAPLLPAELLAELRQDSAATATRLAESVAERVAQLEQQQARQLEFETRRQSIEHAQFQLHSERQQSNEYRTQLTETLAQLQASEQRRQTLLGEFDSATAWQTALQQAVEQARLATQATAQEVHASAQQQVKLAAEIHARQERRDQLENEATQLLGELDTWRQQHPALDDATLQRLLSLEPTEVDALRQALQHSEKAVEHATVLLEERATRLAAHRQQQPPESLSPTVAAERLHAVQAQLEISEQYCAQLRAEQAEDQRRTEANARLQVQIDLANREFQRWARLSTLIGSATGDTFRKIAQAYNLDLLVKHANIQLRQLARRYRLQRGGSMLGLLVMDTEMGDELRSVHSLSGGETFLVSLALALGLASMASSTLKIESLFIDEGFGSLDGQSLQLAMDALDGLQAQGRKVGVISHVQEMHERIPVQIRVTRRGNGLSQVEVG